MEEKLNNLTFIVILGFIINIALIIGLFFKVNSLNDISTNSNKDNQTTTTNPETPTYDVSNMKQVDVSGALDLFKEKGTHILYIGRSDCSVCVKIVPNLNQVQSELKYTTNYFDLNSVSNFKKEMKDLAAKITVKGSANGEEGTIGELFISKGYTPTVVVIKDGKAVDGFIGYRDVDTLKELFGKYL